MPIDPDTRPDATTLAFRLGQIDTLQRVLLASPTLYSPEMRAALGLRWLTRIWVQYRADRGIATGGALIGAECSAARDAFLALLDSMLGPDASMLADAVAVVRRSAIRPLAHERRETTAIVAASHPILAAVLEALHSVRAPRDPVARLDGLVTQFRYSTTLDDNPLSATAQTPCWAINLAAAAHSRAFGLVRAALPVPGVVSRKMFRADRDADARRSDIAIALDAALHETACDIALIQRADHAFRRDFTRQRSHSRLYAAWMLLFALGELTPSHLARALPATKAGAAKLLRQLVAARFAYHPGAHAPYACAVHFPVAFPAWGHDPGVAPPHTPLCPSFRLTIA
jgi:hypothetical protein